MRLKSFLSPGSVAVVAIVCLLSVPTVTQKAPKGSAEGAGQTEPQVNNGSGDRQSVNPRSENPATDGRVNVTVTPQNGEKGEAGSSPKGWIPWLISVVLSWPFLAAAFVIFLLLNPQRVQNVLLPFDSVKIFGAEFKVVGSSGANAERAIQVYREDVKKRFNKIVKSAEIDKKHKAIVDKLLDGTSGILKGVDFRSTIYVPDMLFDESLYQLLDYYPMPPTGGKKGRVFSARYGMIGRCWRSEESVFQGKVPTDPKDLVNEWAMTRKEAKKQRTDARLSPVSF